MGISSCCDSLVQYSSFSCSIDIVLVKDHSLPSLGRYAHTACKYCIVEDFITSTYPIYLFTTLYTGSQEHKRRSCDALLKLFIFSHMGSEYGTQVIS